MPEEPSKLQLFFAKLRLIWPWVVAAPFIIFVWGYAQQPYVMVYLKNYTSMTHAWVRFGGNVLVLCFFISFALYMLRLRIKVRAENGRMCPYCKYSLKNLPGPSYCPECGRSCPKDGYLSFWSKVFWHFSFNPVIPGRGSSNEHARRNRIVRLLLRLASVSLSLAILFELLPSMNCMAELLRGCKCYYFEFSQLLSEVLLSVVFAFCFYFFVGLNLELQLFDSYLRRNLRPSKGAGL